MDRNVRRLSRRNLHNYRVANFGHEYESRADLEFRSWRTGLDVSLDLFCRAASGNAAGCGSLPTTEHGARNRLREAAPPQQPALHLSVQL